MVSSPVLLLAFGFGTGLSSLAPGTVGTLVALPLIWLLSPLPDFGYSVIVLALLLVGVPICGLAAERCKTHDHPGIVWDEIVGMMLTLAFIPFSWTALAAGFVLFRIFDIFKPWPIRQIDRRVKGGLGIMLDDIVAAIFANIALRILLQWL